MPRSPLPLGSAIVACGRVLLIPESRGGILVCYGLAEPMPPVLVIIIALSRLRFSFDAASLQVLSPPGETPGSSQAGC